MIDRGNGYFECEVGHMDAGLISADYRYAGDIMIARTAGELIIGYADSCSARDVQEVLDWADEYDFPVEWK